MSHTVETSEFLIPIDAVLATRRAFDPVMLAISCTSIPYVSSQYNLASTLLSSCPAEAAYVSGGAPFPPWYTAAASTSYCSSEASFYFDTSPPKNLSVRLCVRLI